MKKRKGGAGNEATLDGPAPDPVEPAPRRKIRKSKQAEPSDSVTIPRAELDALNAKLASSSAQVELYQFQIKKLREDLDHIKLHSVLANLGGPVVISEDRPPLQPHHPEPAATEEQPAAEAAPDEPAQEEVEEQPAAVEDNSAEEPNEEGQGVDAAAEDTADILQADESGEQPIDMDGVRANFFACFETISTMTKMYGVANDELKKKDTLIELLKERIELHQQSSETDTVPVEQYSALLTQMDEMKAASAAESESLRAEIESMAGEKEDACGRAAAAVAALKESEDARGAREAELGRDIEKLRAEILELNEKIQASERERAGAESDVVSSLHAENAKLRDAVKTLDGELDAEKKGRAEDVARLEAEAAEARNAAEAEAGEKMSAQEQSAASLAARIAQLEKHIEEQASMHEGELLNAQKRLDDMAAAREEDARQAAERMKFHTDRLKAEYDEIRTAMEAREEEAIRLEKQTTELDGEIARLKKENFALMSRLEATRVKAADSAEKDFAGSRGKLLERFSKDASPSTLLDLRELFISSHKYDEAVRTFRKLLIEPGNQKFMPAVCLLVGEFYNLAGRAEEGAFYLANPLIRDDSFARQLLDGIEARRTSC